MSLCVPKRTRLIGQRCVFERLSDGRIDRQIDGKKTFQDVFKALLKRAQLQRVLMDFFGKWVFDQPTDRRQVPMRGRIERE